MSWEQNIRLKRTRYQRIPRWKKDDSLATARKKVN
nr:MAG TPA: colicin-M immunity protein [Caudoviricetes sp.]